MFYQKKKLYPKWIAAGSAIHRKKNVYVPERIAKSALATKENRTEGG
jgi:hypothetical protein